jgi:adenylate cyclase
MSAPGSDNKRALVIGGIIGALLTGLVGWVGLLPLGDGLARYSYDIPFVWSHSHEPDDLVMVYLDQAVKRNLGEPVDMPLNRRYYASLVDRLTHDGARLVIFDLLFDEPAADPAADNEFADAIRRNGHVILAGDYERVIQGIAQTDELVPPTAQLTSAATGWGVAKCPLDADYGIRRLIVGNKDEPTLGWVAASSFGAPTTNWSPANLSGKWLNYYCRPARLQAVNLDWALTSNAPSGYFHDKIVVVGARPEAGVAGDKRETFRTPYSLSGAVEDAPGPAVQGFNVLNLIHGDWMNRLSNPEENTLVIAWGIMIGLGLLAFRPWVAMFVSIVLFLLMAAIAVVCHVYWLTWFNWLVPAAVQLPVALVWAVGYRYLVADQRRRQLRSAFAKYLSPAMADRIANSEFSLELGGKEVEASVMFTDLESFSKMSETLSPSEVSRILTTYFNQTTKAILDEDGTIVKYIGDAVMAVWGAPLPEKNHAQRAVIAAWGMSQASKLEVAGRKLRTRIGVNTGIVLSGNLGSEYRFDYTCIGNTTNFASRLEGLNKYLGTDVLISESTKSQLDASIQLRPLGRFKVAGIEQAVAIYEVMGPSKDFPQMPPWYTEFATALQAFQAGKLDDAERGFQQAIALRDGKDGPSTFFVKQIAKARTVGADMSAWDGAVRLDEK